MSKHSHSTNSIVYFVYDDDDDENDDDIDRIGFHQLIHTHTHTHRIVVQSVGLVGPLLTNYLSCLSSVLVECQCRLAHLNIRQTLVLVLVVAVKVPNEVEVRVTFHSSKLTGGKPIPTKEHHFICNYHSLMALLLLSDICLHRWTGSIKLNPIPFVNPPLHLSYDSE